jgi:uncharacterized protein (TIGR03089 family)
VPPSTFPAVLDEQVRRAGSRPLVTFYDDVTGERVELSVVTYANWVAKTASLLQDELDVQRGDTVLVDLPTHWLGPVWLGAAWCLGAAVCDDCPDPAVVLCGATTVERWAAAGAAVVATSLLPMAARFTEALPAGVVDFGAVVWGQPDAFVAVDPPAPDDVAWATDLTQAALLRHLPAELSAPGVRLLTDVNPCSRAGLATLVGPLAAGGGTVWVRADGSAELAGSEGWDRRAEVERVTARLRTVP